MHSQIFLSMQFVVPGFFFSQDVTKLLSALVKRGVVVNSDHNGKTISEVKDLFDFDGDIVKLLGEDPFPGKIENYCLLCHIAFISLACACEYIFIVRI